MSRKNLTRLEVLPIEEVVPFLGEAPSTLPVKPRRLSMLKMIRGHKVKTYSLRLNTFLFKGMKCALCGLQATHFAIEQQFDQDRPHLNLYAATTGGDMLFTCDHIIPLSKGGDDDLKNTQTLCHRCNNRKGDMIVMIINPTEEAV